jgi:hypothetical protein
MLLQKSLHPVSLLDSFVMLHQVPVWQHSLRPRARWLLFIAMCTDMLLADAYLGHLCFALGNLQLALQVQLLAVGFG